MKIDEECINHNVTNLIDGLLLWDMLDEGDERLRLMTLGYIQGMIELAGELKKVLKA